MLKLITAVFFLSLSGIASASSVEAPGEVLYKMPSGEIISRTVTLVVPSRGAGDVILRGSTQDTVADRFFSVESKGRTVFYVVFEDFPGAQAGEVAVYRGTYSRGTNQALYYGDVYVGTPVGQSDESLHGQFVGDNEQNFRYVAAFYFRSFMN